MDKKGWNVGTAKQQFSEVLRRSENDPQLIYRRNRLIAAVISVDETKVANEAKRATIGDHFEAARELLLEENYRLPHTMRRSRRNAS